MVRGKRVVVMAAVAVGVLATSGCPREETGETRAGGTEAAEAAGDEAPATDAGAAAEGGDAAVGEAAAAEKPLGPPTATAEELVPGEGPLWAIFRTNQGDMLVRLYEDEAPRTVANFVGLATGQVPYRGDDGEITEGRFYDGTIFHRVIPGFMIQGGDPTGTGRGGPGYRFADEAQNLTFDAPGYLAMANAGPNTNGSQFFITDAPTPHLNGRHTIFGRLVKGADVVGKIARVRTGPGNRPINQVVLEKLEIVRSKDQPTLKQG